MVFFIFSASISLSCNAGNEVERNYKIADELLKKYISPKVVLGANQSSDVKQGDFNGDGIDDLAVVFLPLTKLAKSANVNAVKLWDYPSLNAKDKMHKSLAVFHGSKKGWHSDDIQAYVFLDNTGALETPSFELIVSKGNDKNYKENISFLPIKIKTDLIIIPTEAGIDTYLYWIDASYKLYEPDEMP